MKRLDRMPTYIHMTMAFMGGLWGAYSVVQWTNLGNAHTTNLIKIVLRLIDGDWLEFALCVGSAFLYFLAFANTARAICVMRLSLLRRYRWLQSISFHKIGLYIHVCILVCSQQRFSGPYFVVRRASTVLRSSTVTITANFLLRLQKYI